MVLLVLSDQETLLLPGALKIQVLKPLHLLLLRLAGIQLITLKIGFLEMKNGAKVGSPLNRGAHGKGDKSRIAVLHIGLSLTINLPLLRQDGIHHITRAQILLIGTMTNLEIEIII